MFAKISIRIVKNVKGRCLRCFTFLHRKKNEKTHLMRWPFFVAMQADLFAMGVVSFGCPAYLGSYWNNEILHIVVLR